MVDKELFERYEKALGANAALFSNAVRDLSAEVDGMDGDSMRAHLGDRYPALVRAYGTVAAEAAREFYETQRAMSGGAQALGEYESTTSYPEWLDAESEVQVNTVSAGVGQAVGSAVHSFLEGRGTKSVMGCADSTLDFNATRDPAHPKWALVPHLGACSWCVMIGSRGFTYSSERSIGAQRHNRCKCTPIVDFDTKNPKLEGYDPDNLYEQYKAAEESGETSFRQRKPASVRSYKKRERRTVDARRSHAQANKLIEYLEKAEGLEDFKRRALKVDEQWRKSKHEGGAYEKLRKRYIELAKKWGIDPNKRPDLKGGNASSRNAVKAPFKGSFGNATSESRRIYSSVKGDDFVGGMVEKFNDRHDGMLEVEGKISRIGKDNMAALLAGIEHGGQFVGTSPSKVKLVSTLKLKSGVIAQAERRGEDVIIRFNANRLRGMTQDQVEQIAFHEMAHTAEYRIVSDSQFAKEVENLLAFQSDPKRTLPKPKASERLENALQNAGFNAEYDPKSGKMNIKGEAAKMLRELPEYARKGADLGTQDSELIAESIRFVALHGYGRNHLADVVTKAFI